MEDFKRPDHPDFMDSIELKKIEFSGIRHNSLSDYLEFWIDGDKKFELSMTDYQLDPTKWTKMMEEYLGLHHVEFLPEKGN